MQTQEQPSNLEGRTGKHMDDVATSPGGSFFLTLCLWPRFTAGAIETMTHPPYRPTSADQDQRSISIE